MIIKLKWKLENVINIHKTPIYDSIFFWPKKMALKIFIYLGRSKVDKLKYIRVSKASEAATESRKRKKLYDSTNDFGDFGNDVEDYEQKNSDNIVDTSDNIVDNSDNIVDTSDNIDTSDIIEKFGFECDNTCEDLKTKVDQNINSLKSKIKALKDELKEKKSNLKSDKKNENFPKRNSLTPSIE